MAEANTTKILRQLRSRDSDEAWSAFIDEYAPLILQVIRHFETDSDDASDCFQFVCERLCEGRFRRLRRFESKGPAKFSTWLRAVVRNLCLDWRRKQLGRKRVFRSISRLTNLDQEIFHLVFERREGEEDALASLAPRYPDLTSALVTEAVARINNTLTTNQNWLLQARAASTLRRATAMAENYEAAGAVDSSPDPEALAILLEHSQMLNRALRSLSITEKLLIRLRFEEELTLEQIARLLELGNAQRVDRQIKHILSSLRLELNSMRAGDVDGKLSTSSVKAS